MVSDSRESLKVPAIRATMGDWIYYICLLKMEDVAARVSVASEIHITDSLKELLQRSLGDRSKNIAEYLLSQPQRFFNSLVVGTYGGNPNWYELAVKTDGSKVDPLPDYIEGTLGILHLDGSETLWAIDGQHRVAGIRQALKAEPTIGTEEISVIFVAGVSSTRRGEDPEGFERTRRLFTTLNRYAKPVSKKDIIALDEDDVAAIVTRRLVEEHDLLRNRISVTASRSIPASDTQNLTTITFVYDIADIILRDMSHRAWRHYKTLRPSDSDLEKYYREAAEFWTLLFQSFPALRNYHEAKPRETAAEQFRHSNGGHLLFRPIGQRIVSDVAAKLSQVDLSYGEALERISRLPMELSGPPWAELLWDTENQRMLYSRENQNVAEKLMFYFVTGSLEVYRTELRDLFSEYAGILNRDLDEIKVDRFRI